MKNSCMNLLDIRKQVIFLERTNIIKYTEGIPGNSLFTNISWQLFPPTYLMCCVACQIQFYSSWHLAFGLTETERDRKYLFSSYINSLRINILISK